MVICYNLIKDKFGGDIMRTAFDRNISPSCEYCCNSKRLSAPDEMLCPKQGVVKTSYSCKQFKYNPLKRVPKKMVASEHFTQADFSMK